MHWSYQQTGFKYATYMQDSLFLRAVPEPCLVQRAKRIRWMFPTLPIIFLGPISWKLQCSYNSLYQREVRCLLIPTMHAIIVRGTKCILHLTAVGKKKVQSSWLTIWGWTSEQVSKEMMVSALCWWSLLVIIPLQQEYFVKGRKEISVLIPLRLKAMGKLDKDRKTHETEALLRLSSWTVLRSVSSK